MSAAVEPQSVRPRILALDALRGLTILFMILVNNPGDWNAVYGPLAHAPWHGWTPTDLVFPFFLFVVGASVVLGLSRRRQAQTPGLHGHILRRSLVLVGIGLFLSAFPFVRDFASWELKDLGRLRYPGVLQRIGICYGLAALLYLHCSRRTLLLVTLSCLLGYAAALCWVPVPGYGAGMIDAADKEANLVAFLDRQVLGTAHLWRGRGWDPEGLLSTVPALATTLVGVFAGLQLQAPWSRVRQAAWLVGVGALLLLLGLFWGQWLPINKPLWTSSYALFSAGAAMLGLGVFLLMIDVLGWRRLVGPLQVYGVNALAVFVGSALLGRLLVALRFEDGGGRLVSAKTLCFEQGFVSWIATPERASLAYALVWVAGWYLVLRQMHRRGWIIKL